MPKTCRVLYQNKVEKQCITLAFIIRIHHDTRTSECQKGAKEQFICFWIIKLLMYSLFVNNVSNTNISHKNECCVLYEDTSFLPVHVHIPGLQNQDVPL